MVSWDCFSASPDQIGWIYEYKDVFFYLPASSNLTLASESQDVFDVI